MAKTDPNNSMFSIEEQRDLPVAPSDKQLLAPSTYKFMIMEVGHTSIVLPYEAATEIMKHLRNAETVENYESWASKTGKILPLDRNKITFKILSQEDYLLWKTNALLGGQN